ncbi:MULTISPECIES: hypothetical protein [unclassified Streptomyces]|nr:MULTISPECIES: hypothetical protein [unclassified Streptomyces]
MPPNPVDSPEELAMADVAFVAAAVAVLALVVLITRSVARL